MQRLSSIFVVALVVLRAALPADAAERKTNPAGDPIAPRVLVNVDKDGVALQGYDPVAYFTDGMPVKGDPRHMFRHEGAVYHFASDANMRTFAANPPRYEPRYGGYCGYAASIDRLSPISPEWFQIDDGRLVLQHNKKAFDLWNEDSAASQASADANWPGLVSRHGVGVRARRLMNLDGDGVALQGHDPVAYFAEGKPVPGSRQFEAVYNGATYRFQSIDHREQFERNPSRYEPAFGGYCGYAASINKVSPVDPTIFQILNGRLVLQHTSKAYELFNKNPLGNLARADRNWPGLEARRGR